MMKPVARGARASLRSRGARRQFLGTGRLRTTPPPNLHLCQFRFSSVKEYLEHTGALILLPVSCRPSDQAVVHDAM